MIDMLRDWPDAVWAAIATGAFLIGQNILNNRREDRRKQVEAADREADRRFQLEQAEQARADARAEAWRSQRRDAHSNLIALLVDTRRKLDTAVSSLPRDGEFVVRGDKEVTVITQSISDELRRHLAEVQIIATERARQAAKEANDRLLELDLHVWFATLPFATGVTNQIEHEHLVTRSRAIPPLIEAYVDAARIDLGTAD